MPAQEVPKADEHAPAPAAHAPAGEHGPAEEAPDPLEPKPELAIWTLVVFIGLFLLLGKFAWKPLLNALHQRERHLEHVLEETERARNESEGLLAEHRRQMARAADEVRAILDKARQDAQAAAEQIVKQAQTEAEAARQRAQRDIATARDQALAEIWEKAADTAVADRRPSAGHTAQPGRPSPPARRGDPRAAGRCCQRTGGPSRMTDAKAPLPRRQRLATTPRSPSPAATPRP